MNKKREEFYVEEELQCLNSTVCAESDKTIVRFLQSRQLSSNINNTNIYMTAEMDKSFTVNRPHRITWERFETLTEDNTENEANTQAFGWPDGLWA